EYLRHIQVECDFILSVVGDDLDKESFLRNETLKRAVVRSLEVIGEATKKIDPQFRARWTEINWKNMAGMRDRLIHDYMGTDHTLVWDVIRNKIPYLKEQVDRILASGS